MLIGTFDNIKIAGISTAVPKSVVKTESFNDIFGKKVVDDFSQMVGIKEYRKSELNQTSADFAIASAKDVIEKQNIDKSKIGVVIFVTQKPDYRIPSTAFFIHKELGLSSSCIALDLNLACSGFIFAVHTVASILNNSEIEYGLVLTGDTSSRTMSPEDRTTIMLFGDSGTATLLKNERNGGQIKTALRTNGQSFKSIITPAGAYRNTKAPIERVKWSDGIKRSDYDTRMKGMEVFTFSITDVPKLLKDYLRESGKTPEDYDFFALHQANMYILKQLSRKVKLPWEKVLLSIETFGNNSSNSVPLTLCKCLGEDTGNEYRFLMSGFGAGLSWGCADASINSNVINPLIEI